MSNNTDAHCSYSKRILFGNEMMENLISMKDFTLVAFGEPKKIFKFSHLYKKGKVPSVFPTCKFIEYSQSLSAGLNTIVYKVQSCWF
jgi:hypothetical protein